MHLEDMFLCLLSVGQSMFVQVKGESMYFPFNLVGGGGGGGGA